MEIFWVIQLFVLAAFAVLGLRTGEVTRIDELGLSALGGGTVLPGGAGLGEIVDSSTKLSRVCPSCACWCCCILRLCTESPLAINRDGDAEVVVDDVNNVWESVRVTARRTAGRFAALLLPLRVRKL